MNRIVDNRFSGERGSAQHEGATLDHPLVASSLSGVYVYDLWERRNVFISPAYTEITGYRSEELAALGSRRFMELFHPHDREAVSAHIQALADDEQDDCREIEYRFRTREGSFIWCRSRDTPLQRDASGKVVQLIGSLVDVTARKRAERSALVTEERFRAALANPSLAVATCDVERRYTWAHNHYPHLDAEEVIGKRDEELAPAQDVAELVDLKRAAIERDEPVRRELSVVMAGQVRRFDASAEPLRDDEGKLFGLTLVTVDVTERLQAERQKDAALRREREANALLDAIFAAAPIGLGFWDRGLRFRRINARLAEINGLPAEAHLGKRPDELLPGIEGLEQILERWRKVLATGKPWLDVEVNGQTHTPSQARRTWRESFFPVQVEGETIGLGAVVEEVTEQKRVEQELRNGEARERARAAELQTILDTVPAGVFVARDLDCREITANRAGYEMLGLRGGNVSNTLGEGEPTRNAARAVKGGQDIPPGELPIQRAARGEVTRDYELDLVNESGEVRHWFGNAVPLLDEQGKRVGAVGAFTDVTDSKRSAIAAGESERRLQTFIDNAPSMMGLVEVNPDDSDVFHLLDNAATARFFGVEPGETAGKWARCDLGASEATIRRWVQAYREAQASGRAVRFPYAVPSTADMAPEQQLWLDVSVSHVGPGDEGRQRFCYTAVDDTERKRIESALHEADRRKEDFLAVLAHELRNPLAALCGGLEVLQAGATDEQRRRVQPIMQRQATHLVHLVDELLEVSRISRGKIALRRSTVDLRRVVEAAIELVQPAIDERKHHLVVGWCDRPLQVNGDFERLVQVLGNLLSNAVKYTSGEGEIRVQMWREQGHGFVRVSDNGRGIPRERLPSLFQLFNQMPEHRDLAGGGGLGVGLALSQQLAELHAGTIQGHSEGLGHGSEFTVRIPLQSSSEHATVDTGISAMAVSHQRRVLIVDDNVDAAEMLSSLLELKGHVLQTVHGGQAALEAARDFEPDVVLLDIGLPDMDGYEVARRLRSTSRGQSMRLYAVTGWGQAEDQRLARQAGFDEHFRKPVDTQRLYALLSA